MENLSYLTGFNNEHETEALPGALPKGQFSPQKVNYKLYAEQFSSTAFTAPRAENRRSWTYRLRPSIAMGDFIKIDNGLVRTAPETDIPCPPNVLRWDPIPLPQQDTDFVDYFFNTDRSQISRLLNMGSSSEKTKFFLLFVKYYLVLVL